MPHIKPFRIRELGPKAWGTELLVAHTDGYTGKVLTMEAGKSGPLQYHEQKDETFFLYEGTAIVRYHDDQGKLREMHIAPGTAIHVPPGAVHQVEAVTRCVLFEASNPVFNDRVAVQAHG